MAPGSAPRPGPPGRDRDELGRPRNARPRDALGRPLPPGSHGVEPIPEDLDLEPAEALSRAQDLLDRGRAFNAHEVLEGSWKSCPPAERELWHGITQLAVGITHIQRGNAKGALTLLHRAQARLAGAVPLHRVDATGLATYARTLIADLESGLAPGAIPADRLKPRLQLP
ncbi:MAG: DUF309 domain-containing protein [Mycobacteriaceae bacterium]|nr:DUF309 domain-containing protein [Mycobacteriaceae bacterium]